MKPRDVRRDVPESDIGREKARDDGSEIRERGDSGGAFDVDAADGDDGNAGGSARGGRAGEPVESDDRVGALLRLGVKDGTERDVVGAQGERGVELRMAVRRDADAQRGSEAPDVPNVEVFLSHVDAVAAGKHREIRTIVREEQDAALGRERAERAEPSQNVARSRPFGTKLNDGGSRRDHALGERNQRNASAFRKIGVDDGVEPAHRPAS